MVVLNLRNKKRNCPKIQYKGYDSLQESPNARIMHIQYRSKKYNLLLINSYLDHLMNFVEI
jgi:hypothetical protein